MLTGIAKAKPSDTVKDVLDRLYAPTPKFDTLDYVFVVDDAGTLLGTVSLKDLINKPKKKRIDKIMSRKLFFVHPDTDQEHVATMALRHRIKAVPVVDAQKKLLGVVPPRKIFDILHMEHTEDMLRLAGITASGPGLRGALKSGIFKMSMLRLPSLIIGIVGGLAATSVVETFQSSLESEILLAFFIPLILYLSSAAAAQTGTILVRTLATEQVNIRKYVVRELAIGVTIATVIGLIIFLIINFWHGDFLVALSIGLSLFISISFATVLGLSIPWILQKMNKDPAVSGGPIITVMQDIISLVIYFSVASVVLF